ncbi:DUF21 domain-containing protein isoform G [Glycine soja]|uniref:DUF21 domain-containing protein isoform C n=1 Tax=Glycine soja TaxID=3848 RepID=A0A445I7T6_GLYSO|nr:DUF21 domain-containing protein isoform C [Glycine soja]RZB82070.1 DUF21 domain-containing protein isoform D [Glycine soja]RZB82071.1 DUF21 domain-containing protein isoform E [Glycine soja]RZB82072.1 DUF21 domain-containing protein isoform F [Glycine soja]RZB82073.1 DUF21 domain-containing protein isoform G [Glycine soja]
MNVVSALMVTRNQLGAPEGIPFGSVWLFVYAGISFSLVIFAGIMSAVILPVVQKQHQLLVTLLLCNAAAMDIDCRRGHDSYSPIESTFSLDVNSKLDWEAMGKILALGHGRVPVYSGNPKNIIGLLLVKSLLTVLRETETPISAVSIRRIPQYFFVKG